MRIIAGKYRGLTIRTLKGDRLRPTSDQMRETLFDVLGPRVAGSRFLDAYAGSGAVGLEALSRGASVVVFIEHHRSGVELIGKNLARLEIESGFEVMGSSTLGAFERLESEGAMFDFVFLDPPYAEIAEYHRVLRQLARSTLLAAGAVVIAEHSRRTILEETYGHLQRTRLIRHGDAQLAFYRLAETYRSQVRLRGN
jgi:16S rRNA (guanine966-N2)-methyltransferase